MINSGEIQIKKLSIWDKIRKAMFLIGMNVKKTYKYSKLPESLKYDDDIIREIVKANPSIINFIPTVKLCDIIIQNPSLNSIVEFERKAEMLLINPIISKYLEKNDLFKIIHEPKYLFDKRNIKLFPDAIQVLLLSEDAEYTITEFNEFSQNKENIKKNISKNAIPLENFSEDVILQYAIYQENINKEKDSELLGRDISKLSLDTQLKLMLINNKYCLHASDEARIKFVGDNPTLYEMLPEKILEEKIKQDPFTLGTLPEEKQEEYLIKKQLNLSSFHGTKKISIYNFKMGKFNTPEECKNLFIKKRYKTKGICNLLEIIDHYDDDFIWEIGIFDPELVLRVDNSDYRNYKIINILYQKLKNNYENSPLTNYVDDLSKKNMSTELGKKVKVVFKISTNKDIISRVSHDKLIDYIEEPTHEKLYYIVKETYGEEAAGILKERPEITLDEIPNLYIFHPNIIKEFGSAAVHASLSYNLNISAEFSEFARNPEKMEEYRRFSKITEGLFDSTIDDLERKIVTFEYCRELLKNMDGKELTEEQKQNLFYAIYDVSIEKHQEYIKFPTSERELNLYLNERKKCINAIQKLSDPNKIKKAMSQYFFGMDYSNEVMHAEMLRPNVTDMCRFYNLRRFINEEETLSSELFSEDDLDALEILDIIMQVDDPIILKELAQELDNNSSIINLQRYQELSKKIPRQYSHELIKELISGEKAEELVRNNIPGISMRECDGIKIITLEGTDFTAYITNPNLNNTGIADNKVESQYIANLWKNKENGISTWSGNIINQDVEKSCVLGVNGYGLGFSDLDESQIVAMGTTDLNSSKDRRKFGVRIEGKAEAVEFAYSKEFMRKTARRLSIEDKFNDVFHQYNEVTSFRVPRDLKVVQQNTAHGGKIMPNYIYAYGRGKGEGAIELAKEFGVKYIIEYDNEAYLGRMYRKGKEKPTEVKEREESSFVKKVKSIVRGKENEER